jgi:hypothetical protein
MPSMKMGRSHVVRTEAIGRRVELGMGDRLCLLEGIEIGLERASHAIGADHLDGANGVDNGTDGLRQRTAWALRRRSSAAVP